jgi:hypothetical protein
LRGLDRQQTISLRAASERFGLQSFDVRPVGQPRAERTVHGIDAGGYMNVNKVGPDPGQAEEPTFTLAPGRVLEGRVLYADTGKPATGARVLGALTDAAGRFQVPTAGPAEQTVLVYAPRGSPYLAVHRRVRWPRGVLRHEIEIRLPRGVLVRGKVTDAATGAPVAGASVQYHARDDNRNLPRNAITGYDRLELSDADGAFRIAVAPGPGHLLFQGPTPDYVHVEVDSDVVRSGRAGGERLYPDAALKLDVPAGGGVPELSVRLRRGVTVRGRLVGPDGKPVPRAMVLHRLYVWVDLGWHFPTEARDGVFAVPGLAPEQTVPVFFLDPVNQCGAVARLSGKQAGQEVTVRLEPCGKATARYLDGRGKPLAGAHYSPEIIITPGRPLNGMGRADGALAADEAAVVNLDRHNYWDKVKTDAQGRVTFPALIPGATYRVRRFEGDFWAPHKEFVAQSGKTLDLGDVPVRPRD